MRFLITLFLFLAALPISGRAAEDPSDPILGFWWTQEHDGGVQFYPCGSDICGRFLWIKDDSDTGVVTLDKHNIDSSKRDRPLCHLEFITGFVPKGDGHYSDGTIYSPMHGVDFKAGLTLVNPDKLELHGYVFVPFIGQTQTWTRAQTMPDCAADRAPDTKDSP